MLRTLPFASLIFLFSSCTAYQYLAVSSNNMPQNDQHEFVTENDSVRLKYRFDGYGAPVQVEVVNKLSKPIYVDWKRSALIVENRAYSYKTGSLTVSGGTYTSVDSWPERFGGSSTTSTSSAISGTVEFPGDLEFIPPTAQINQSDLNLTSGFHVGKAGEFGRARILLDNGRSANVMRATYDESNSPLKFSSYLTLFVDPDLKNPVVFHHFFYVSEVFNSGLGPHNFRFFNEREGDRFYLSKSSGVGRG